MLPGDLSASPTDLARERGTRTNQSQPAGCADAHRTPYAMKTYTDFDSPPDTPETTSASAYRSVNRTGLVVAVAIAYAWRFQDYARHGTAGQWKGEGFTDEELSAFMLDAWLGASSDSVAAQRDELKASHDE